jgi:hypothetical protein
MQPKLKRIGPEEGLSHDLRTKTPTDLKPSGENTAANGAEPQIRQTVTADKFAYLRAQVQVFRRSK